MLIVIIIKLHKLNYIYYFTLYSLFSHKFYLISYYYQLDTKEQIISSYRKTYLSREMSLERIDIPITSNITFQFPWRKTGGFVDSTDAFTGR